MQVDRVQFELPQMLIGQTVVIRYNPTTCPPSQWRPRSEPIRVAPLDSVATPTAAQAEPSSGNQLRQPVLGRKEGCIDSSTA